jgi:hypothetical protein
VRIEPDMLVWQWAEALRKRRSWSTSRNYGRRSHSTPSTKLTIVLNVYVSFQIVHLAYQRIARCPAWLLPSVRPWYHKRWRLSGAA